MEGARAAPAEQAVPARRARRRRDWDRRSAPHRVQPSPEPSTGALGAGSVGRTDRIPDRATPPRLGGAGGNAPEQPRLAPLVAEEGGDFVIGQRALALGWKSASTSVRSPASRRSRSAR